MKPKLPLKNLLTNKRLNEMRKEYNNPLMTKQEAYKKVIAVSNFMDKFKAFSERR